MQIIMMRHLSCKIFFDIGPASLHTMMCGDIQIHMCTNICIYVYILTDFSTTSNAELSLNGGRFALDGLAVPDATTMWLHMGPGPAACLDYLGNLHDFSFLFERDCGLGWRWITEK